MADVTQAGPSIESTLAIRTAWQSTFPGLNPLNLEPCYGRSSYAVSVGHSSLCLSAFG